MSFTVYKTVLSECCLEGFLCWLSIVFKIFISVLKPWDFFLAVNINVVYSIHACISAAAYNGGYISVPGFDKMRMLLSIRFFCSFVYRVVYIDSIVL